MKTLENVYQNRLGSSYNIFTDYETSKDFLALEINQVSFVLNEKELKSFIKATESIINYHSDCTCPKDLENKMVIYQSKQTEIRMKLSYNQLILLKDLLKGTNFKLSMGNMLKKYKII